MIDFESFKKDRMYKALLALVLVVSVYFGVKALLLIADGSEKEAVQNVITVSGHGEVTAIPDLATLYFTIEDSKDTQKQAADEVNAKVKKVVDFLKGAGVEEKDIKTEGYNSYPKYSQGRVCPMYYSESMPPCTPGDAKIVGYTVSQSITVKVRKIDDSLSKILDGINGFGVTNMSGPTLTVDDEDGLKAEARKEAIKEAKKKAKVLAEQLGVRLGDVTSFNENSGGGYSIYYAKSEMAMGSADAVAPQLPKGENTISSDVTITYEIK
ncbi:MAG: SIMPL domain-containing protein [Candidatus Paceibacteria bacterium]